MSLNRLPGWDKGSYGYHGDDGHSFNSTGTGKAYGPTFDTGDVIGCGVDLHSNCCFYTKNGVNLGIAFRNLPKSLYATVGVESPGEVVEANFGQSPFVFDFEGHRREIMTKIEREMMGRPMPLTAGQWDEASKRLVSDYLVHYGYHHTAMEFATVTGQEISEQIASMKNRQQIQKLVLDGRISDAIELTTNMYPQVFQDNSDLLFRLKTRGFIEMIAGNDVSLPNTSTISNGKIAANGVDVVTSAEPARGDAPNPALQLYSDMEVLDSAPSASTAKNGGNKELGDVAEAEAMDVVDDGAAAMPSVESGRAQKPSTGIWAGDRMEQILIRGKELQELCEKFGSRVSDTSRDLMANAFSLVAYQNPWESAKAPLLDPSGREPICAALNSAILGVDRQSAQPPLNLLLHYSVKLARLAAQNNLGGVSAFVNPSSMLNC